MATALNIKRKNIDLPVEVLKKLSVLAAMAGKSLKKYIEDSMIDKANNTEIEVHENPSPSGDAWFDKRENIAMVMRGIEENKAGLGLKMTSKEVREMLGI